MLASPLQAQLPEKFVVRPDSEPVGPDPWSPGILAGNTLYLSAVGSDAVDGSMPAGADAQIRQAFGNLRRVLLAAGMDYGNVVSCYVFLEDMADQAPLDAVFRDLFARRPPVRSTIGVGGIPGPSRVLVQAIAVQDSVPRTYIPPPARWTEAARWPYSAAIRVNGRLYLSAFGTSDLEAGTRPETPKLQVRQALVNLGGVLEAAGLDFRHVVFVNPYLSPPGAGAALNTVYRQFFEFGQAPARATLTMGGIPGGDVVAFSAVAVDDLSRRQVVRPVSREWSATASPAVFGGDTLYFSGFSGFMPGYGTITDDFGVQVRFAMRNIQDGLEAAGLSLENVVSVNAYLADAGDYERMIEVYAGYFPDRPPALTVVQQSPTGPDNRPLVQFSAIAVRSVKAP